MSKSLEELTAHYDEAFRRQAETNPQAHTLEFWRDHSFGHKSPYDVRQPAKGINAAIIIRIKTCGSFERTNITRITYRITISVRIKRIRTNSCLLLIGQAVVVIVRVTGVTETICICISPVVGRITICQGTKTVAANRTVIAAVTVTVAAAVTVAVTVAAAAAVARGTARD